ncbi:hypothetical protein CH368_06140 [Leptospira levettii]|nr:hypothetical protein CH368_06140 [Leptospira levettii]
MENESESIESKGIESSHETITFKMLKSIDGWPKDVRTEIGTLIPPFGVKLCFISRFGDEWFQGYLSSIDEAGVFIDPDRIPGRLKYFVPFDAEWMRIA